MTREEEQPLNYDQKANNNKIKWTHKFLSCQLRLLLYIFRRLRIQLQLYRYDLVVLSCLVLDEYFSNRWKGNFENHRTPHIWKYCRLGWWSLFVGSNGNAYFCPRRIAQGWAQLNIYTNKQYNFEPS
jgi:hypothetical protein